MATDLPVAKNLIKYNNNLEENDEDKKDPIDIEIFNQKADPENNENAINLR